MRASAYGAGLGDPFRFRTAAQVFRMSGLPRLYESAGRQRAHTSISREGKAELRGAIIDLGPRTAPERRRCLRTSRRAQPPPLPSEEPLLSYPPGVLLVGLTGGIGSGKSTVAGMLAAQGAVVHDADEFARRAVDPGTPGHDRVVETFGSDILTDAGEIDRERLARIVFDDPDARRRLEAIIHPEVGRLFAEAVEAYRGTDRVVVHAVPLLVENHLEGNFDVVVVVSTPEAVRVVRAAAAGSMSEDSVRARMAAQLTDAERERVADVIIRNGGTLEDLEARVDGLWEELRSRATSG